MTVKKEIQIGYISDIINTYPTKYEEGFTNIEIQELLTEYNINYDLFYENLSVNKTIIIDEEFITYGSDIKRILYRILDKRDMYSWQFI